MSEHEGKMTNSPWTPLRYEEGVPIFACAYHPNRETTLRCNRCGRPICTECAILTDVGYRCPDCVRELEGRFYHAAPRHVLNSLLVAILLGFVAGIAAAGIGQYLGIWSIFLAAPVGGIVAEGIWKAGARHRARRLNLYAAMTVAVAGLLGLLLGLSFFPGGLIFGLLLLGITVVTVYGRLR